MRYEWLSQHYWASIDEVQNYATRWMWTHNHDRPNMALGGFTPKQHLAMAAITPLLLTPVGNGGITCIRGFLDVSAN